MTLIKVTEHLFFEATDRFDRLEKDTSNFLMNKDVMNKCFTNMSSKRKFDYVFLGDDAVVYWCERQLAFLKRMCYFLGLEVTVKNVSRSEEEDIFYLGRYWDKDNIPDQTFEYIASHVWFRTKFYKSEDLEFDLEDLDVMRVLNICLPLKSGIDFLNKVFSDWKPLKDFYDKKKPFFVMKEYFYEGPDKYLHSEIPIDVLDF